MKKTLLLLTAVVACAASLQADPINGTVGFTGAFNPANADLTTPSDAITILNPALNGTSTGSFFGAVFVSFASPITLNGAMGDPTFANPLWVITVGVHTFTFTSTSGSTILDTANINTISGTGFVTDSFDNDTANGTWNFSFNVTKVGDLATFTWNGTSGVTTAVPDGGSALTLLGVALAGIEFLRRKFKG